MCQEQLSHLAYIAKVQRLDLATLIPLYLF